MAILTTPSGMKFEKSDILDLVLPPDNACVFLSGTLVEGIGNIQSDIDVYVFADHLPKAETIGGRSFVRASEHGVEMMFDNIDQYGLSVDVEYFTYDQMRSMLARLNGLYAQAKRSSKIFRTEFGFYDEDLIHKVATGIHVSGPPLPADIDIAKARSELCFLKYRNLTGGYPEFKDIRGTFLAEDYVTGLFMTRTYVFDHAMALTFAAGDSNTKTKWLAKKLGRLPQQSSQLGGRILAWLTGPGPNADLRQWMIDGVDLVDDIWSDIRRYIDVNPSFNTSREALVLTEAEYQAEHVHDPQTVEEYDNRRRQFSDSYPPLSSYLKEFA